jgi:hypothetical protein
MKKIRSIVIGLGKVGMGYDFKNTLNNPKKILSHSNALNLHPNFLLCGGVDNSISKKRLFNKKYKAEAFSNYLTAIKKTNPQLVIISTPIKTHYNILKTIIKIKNIKYILCEKPITDSIKKTKEIFRLIKKKKKFLFTNYIRQYDPVINKTFKKLRNNMNNKSTKVKIYYYNGFYNNASHAIFFVGKLFGFKNSINILSATRKKPKIESRVNFQLNFNRVEAQFFSIQQGKRKIINEIEIITKNKKITVSFRAKKILIYSKNRNLASLNTQMYISQYNVYKNLANFLKKKEKFLCNITDALKVETILDSIYKRI